MSDGGASGVAERLAPGLRVVTAPNAGPMTHTGTRSYLVGEAELALIDPGPADVRHLDALAAAVGEARVSAILVTHAHRDHSAGAQAAGARFGAEVLAFGKMPRGAVPGGAGALGGGEGIDAGFRPDRRVRDGETVAGAGWTLQALHTPGHLGDHLCFAWAEGRGLFSGDLVMGWATTLISPPEGDLAAYRASLARLQARERAVFYPGHGAAVGEPRALIAAHLAHRDGREAQIRAVLGRGPADVGALVAEIYTGLNPALRPAAARNVLAHLLDLVARGVVRAEGELSARARFMLC